MADEKPVVPAEQPAAPPAEAPAAAPVVADAPVVVADAAPAAVVEAPKQAPSLLETLEAPTDPAKPAEVAPVEKPPEKAPEAPVEKPPEEKPAEAKTEEPVKVEEKAPEEKPAEVKAEEAPVEPPKLEQVEYKYELPETITLPDERRAQLHEALDGFRADPVGGAQKLLDMHAQAMADHDAHLRAEQFRIFDETKTNWRTQVMADEQIGGAAWKTAGAAIARMRDMFVSSSPRGTPQWEADHAAFVEALNLTGAGDHPAILKFIHNVAQRFDEPAPLPIANVKPVVETARKGNPLHDNPRSQSRQ